MSDSSTPTRPTTLTSFIVDNFLLLNMKDMAIPKMGFFSKFLQLVLLLPSVNPAESSIHIVFHRAPQAWSRSSTAVFQYSFTTPDGANACKNKQCFVFCEVDGKALSSCPADIITLKNLSMNNQHNFLLNVSTKSGERNSTSYSWLIDAIPPTATISSKQNYTNAKTITIEIKFSEYCIRQGGFECINSSNCDVMIDGQARPDASSLRVIEPHIHYSLDLILYSETVYGRATITIADKFCTDRAGNQFRRTDASILIIRIDRRPVMVDLWSPLPSYELNINGVPRNVLATNKMEDLKVYLDFSIPVMNSTDQILQALRVNQGSTIPIYSRNNRNRRFVFLLKNLSEIEIIRIELQAGLVIGRTGTSVASAVLTFLFDSTKPMVGLSTSTPRVTKESNISVIIEFTKPVFGFKASMVEVGGGTLIRFKEISRALYSITVMAVTKNLVSIRVPAGTVTDISGNPNLGSNCLEVNHYLIPGIATSLHSFVTAGVLATSLAAAVLSVSSANLRSTDTLASRNTDFGSAKPSMNLQGMIGHLQVFVLSDCFLDILPIEYSETTKGLRWLIPRHKLPWESYKTWPNHDFLDEKHAQRLTNGPSTQYLSHGRAYHQINTRRSSYHTKHEQPFPTGSNHNFSLAKGLHNISMKNAPYGSALSSNEYFIYFLRGEPLSASNVIKKLENYNGWQDLAKNLFWAGVGGGGLLVVHVGMVLFLTWRTGKPAHKILSLPRFMIFLLVLMLPCISQSSAFVIRGGTTGGIIFGAFLLAIPAALTISVCLFLVIAIFPGNFVQYKELSQVVAEERWYTKLYHFFVGRSAEGKWFYREGMPSSFPTKFGIFFENLKGPAMFVFVDQNDPNTISKWIDHGLSGIGRMRAVSSDESNEEIRIPISRRVLGCARSSYIILDLLRRVTMGVLAGVYSLQRLRQIVSALTITVIQLVYLLMLQPYIGRGFHIVESISLLCEVGIFGLAIAANGSTPYEATHPGYLMLSLLFLTFVVQIANTWYALIKCLLRLSQKDSLGLGLRLAAKGFVLPYLPRKHWSRVIPSSPQPTTNLAAVLPDAEFERRITRPTRVDPFSSMTATVVPVLSPDLRGPDVVQTTAPTTLEATNAGKRAELGKRARGIKLEPKSELKKLQELAKASFSWDSKGEEDSTSYEFRVQSFYPQTSIENIQASTSKSRHQDTKF